MLWDASPCIKEDTADTVESHSDLRIKEKNGSADKLTFQRVEGGMMDIYTTVVKEEKEIVIDTNIPAATVEEQSEENLHLCDF